MHTSLNPAGIEMTPQPMCPECSARMARAPKGSRAEPCQQCGGAGQRAEPRRFRLAELVSAPARWLRWMSLLDT